jgi:hypothetical protein
MKMLFITLLFSFSAYAAPKDIEVWFLSNSKVAELHKLIGNPIRYYPLRAELECQEMGDYCFDPQFGLYKKDQPGIEVSTVKVEEDGPVIPTAHSIDRELIDCDGKNYFDIFCGKARKEAQAAVTKLDLWIDTSASLHEFDFADKDGSCHRKNLVKALDTTCGFNQKVNVMMFDTQIKQAGSMSDLCTNQGLNDYKRLIDWIERSEAKKLVIITDIYEFHKEFSDYIESKHGHFRGDKDALTAKQMEELASTLAKSCQ